ncbi:extracellular solute-binding protein [Propionibacteriaceae bacterium Y1685]
MQRSKLFPLVLAVGFLFVSACSGGGANSETQDKIDNPGDNVNLTGMPIVKDKVTVRFLSSRPPMSAEDWNTTSSMKKMEEMSNVHIDWGTVPSEGVKERRNLAMASGDYPEVIYRTGLTSVDLAKYGEEGTFVPLNTLIDNHMPNLKAILDENPDVRKGLTYPDGNIYGLPTIYDSEFESLKMQFKLWVRKDWLDKFGMEVPTTLDEYKAYLEAVKTKDPNGNGKNDEVGLTDGSKGSYVYQMLRSNFGAGNRGMTAGAIDADPSDPNKVRAIETSDDYKETLTYLHELYAAGLIQPDVFTNDQAKLVSLGTDGLVGSVAVQSPAAFFGKEGENYVAVPPLKKNASDPVPEWNAAGATLRGAGQFALTDKAENPVAIARWMVYFYGEEGARLFFLGIEGGDLGEEG